MGDKRQNKWMGELGCCAGGVCGGARLTLTRDVVTQVRVGQAFQGRLRLRCPGHLQHWASTAHNISAAIVAPPIASPAATGADGALRAASVLPADIGTTRCASSTAAAST